MRLRTCPFLGLLRKKTETNMGEWTDPVRGQIAEIVLPLDIAAAWGRQHHRPIYLGEFGVYEKAPPAARVAWVRYVAMTAERFGWAWAYWQFDHDFALFDSASHSWNQPLLEALMR